MSFDFDGMMSMPWAESVASVETPKAMISAGAPPAFKVRMATAEEMVRANDIHASLEKAKAMVTALSDLGGNRKAAVDAFKLGLGIGEQLPEGYIRQIEFVLMCTVEPVLTREQVLWLARMQPFFFKSLFEKIMMLSYEGSTLGKAKASTETAESE